jgi:SOS response regulatory protein OraA/RecX
MKLYTEKELRKRLFNYGFSPISIENIVKDLPHIELPNDQEIVNQSLSVGFTNTLFSDGAKWLRDKIQGNNK